MFSKAAARVEFGEVLLSKAPFLEQDHGKGIAQSKHVGGTGSGCELKGAGFFLDMGIENEIAVFCQGRRWGTRDGDHERGSLLGMREKGDQFTGLS